MSIKYLAPIDLTQNELQNAILHNIVGDPTDPVEGQVHYNSSTQKAYVYSGSVKGFVEITNSAATNILRGVIKLAGDLGGTADSPEVVSVGGASSSDIADAVAKRHTQNTDTGTTNSTFHLDSDNGGPILKNNAGTLEIRDGSDSDYASLKVLNLTVNGTQTIINSNEVNIGDSELLLNADITTSSENSNGGIAVKRLQSDNSTRADAKINFNNSSGRWEAEFGPVTDVQTQVIATKYVTTVGLGDSTKTFTITHNLNSRDVSVTIRRTASPYDMVFANVTFTSLNALTVSFSKAPALNEYTVTVIG